MARVTVVGEIDLATVSLFRDRLIGVLHDQTPAVVDIDLAGVSFLDCTAIGALVAVRNIAVQAGCQMRIARPRPFISRVLELSGLLDVLTAPVEQPEHLPPDFHLPAGTRPVAATMM